MIILHFQKGLSFRFLSQDLGHVKLYDFVSVFLINTKILFAGN